MPRRERIKSSTGIYHVIFRSINKVRIFFDDEDFNVFLENLKKYKNISGFKLYAYCLMDNHIHLLIKEEKESLSIAFRRIGAGYVHWYNKKHLRAGHLFQDRHKSEPVETDSYFLTVLRYIHQNPQKAKMVKHIHLYPWSSYNEYTGKPDYCDTKFPLNFFSKDITKAKKQLVLFHSETTDDDCLEYDEYERIHDTEAIELMKLIAKVKTPKEIMSMDQSKRDRAVKKMRDRGISIRQIQRATGISFGIIRNL